MFILLFFWWSVGLNIFWFLRNGGEGARVWSPSRKERSRTVLGARESKKVLCLVDVAPWPTCAEAPCLRLPFTFSSRARLKALLRRQIACTGKLPSSLHTIGGKKNAMIDLQSNHYVIKRKMSSCEQCNDSLVNSDSSPSAKK